MKHATKMIGAALIAAGILGCGDTTSSAADQPGMAIVSMTSSNAADGAVSITVRGPGLGAATAARSTYQVFSRLMGSAELKVIVLGDAVDAVRTRASAGLAGRARRLIGRNFRARPFAIPDA